MKNAKKAFLLAAFCLFVIAVMAQPQAGLKGGVNYTSISGYTGSHRVNFHAGVFVQVPLNNKWSVQPELIYSGEGQHYVLSSDEEGHSETEGTITLGYAALPLMLRFHAGPRFFIEAGPRLSVLITAHSLGLGTDDMNMKRSFTNGQFGVNAGAGIFFTKRMGLYGRYYFGMTDITPNDADSDKSRAGQLGVMFRIGKLKAAKAKDKPVEK